MSQASGADPSTSSPAPARQDESTVVQREEIHFRRIDMRAYRRSDGLYEVEGRVTDRKTQDLAVPGEERVIRANDPIHDMGVILVFDQELLIHDVKTFTDAAPHAECPQGGEALRSLVGIRIQSGWSKEVRAKLRGARSCTHLMELLIPMATAAFQSLTEVRFGRPEPMDAHGRPLKIDSCYAYRDDGLVVLKRWPQFSPLRGLPGGTPNPLDPTSDS